MKLTTWEKGVINVLNGSLESFKDDDAVVAPDKLKTFVEKYDAVWIEPEEGGALETNGWQWDWWMNFDLNGAKFTASGSGYYGGFTFGPSED